MTVINQTTDSKSSFAILSLGTNLGDRFDNIKKMYNKVSGFISVSKISSLMETEPVGTDVPQGAYYNLILAGWTGLFPESMLDECLASEKELGRSRIREKGPRYADIDILLYGNTVIDTKRLKIPHPEVMNRYFCLLGINEVAPELIHPAENKRFDNILRERESVLRDQRVDVLGSLDIC